MRTHKQRHYELAEIVDVLASEMAHVIKDPEIQEKLFNLSVAARSEACDIRECLTTPTKASRRTIDAWGRIADKFTSPRTDY